MMPKEPTMQISDKEIKKRDFILHGNLWKVVLSIFIPLFIFSIIKYVYGIVDTIMCTGISKEAVNAVGALAQVNNMVSAIGMGLSTGGSILIAKQIGKNNYKRARELTTTVFTYTVIIGVATCVLVIPFAKPVLRALGITEESIDVGTNYFIISLISQAVIMFNTVFMGVEKAKGSTVLITALNFVVVLIKIGLTALFLYQWNLKSMTYVALATLIANLLLTIYIVIHLLNKKYIFNFSHKDIDFKKVTFKKLAHICTPVFFGKFVFALGKVVVNSMAASYSNDVVGALNISNTMGGSITSPIMSVTDSTSSIISQNIGGGNIKRAINTFYIGLVLTVGIGVIGVVILTIFNTPITMFFARNAGSEQEQIAFAENISMVFFYEKMGIITLGINASVMGLLYGFGYTMVGMVLNIARVFLFRIPSFLFCKDIFKISDGYVASGIAMGFSNIAIGIVAIVTAIIVISREYKKLRKKGEQNVNTGN